ncbi:hypothetical protein HC024_12305 [Methylococcaceae bacterium WWC4]|nr:hypothetical protein [Methylococcaceae bacterium WWC4]
MNLPESWVEARLNDVCLLNPKLASNEHPEEDIEITFVPMSAVDENTGVVARPEVRNYSDVAKGYTSFKEGDVLFAKVTPCMENGKAAIVGPLLNGLGFGSTEFHVLRPTDELLPEYLFHFIRQPTFRARAASAFVGTGGLQRVPPDFMARVKIPLPTLPEQQRIVDVLRQAEAVTKLRQQFESLLVRTKRQLFIEMFGDPNPKGNTTWPIVKLGNAVVVATGGTPSREQADNFGGSVSWVKSTDLTDTPIRQTDECVTELGIQRSNVRVYPKNTIFLAMYGQGQTRGRTGKLLIEAGCNQACAALLPSEELLPDYLWVWLQLSYEQVRALGRGGQQENLNLDIVRDIALPKPPIPLQQEFSRRLQQLLEVVSTMQLAKRQAETLLASVSIEAITGEATSEWREQHRTEIEAAIIERDTLLRERGAKVSVRTEVFAPPERPTDIIHPTRYWLLNELSEFQGFVLDATREWKGTILADNASDLDEFCRLWPIEHERNMHDKVKRALEQLAALGLIAKVALPNENGDFVNGYRRLRPEEKSRLNDIARLQASLENIGHEKGTAS